MKESWAGSALDLARLVHASNDLVGIADFRGHFTAINPAFERTLGWSAEEVLARPFIEFVHPEDRESTTAAARLLATGGQVQTFRNRYQTKPGGYRLLVWSAVGVPEQSQIIAIGRDETQRREAELAAQEAHSRLEEADAFRRQMLNNVVHDLNSSLTPMKLQMRILSGPNPPADLSKGLKIVSRNLDQVQRLVADLVDVAKLDSGQLKMQRTQVSLEQVIQDTVGTFSDDALQRGIELHAEAGPKLSVNGDEGRLKQVASNLITNALKFTPRDGRISVRLDSVHGNAVVTIRDTGRGLTIDEADKLFKPFSQVHEPSEIKERGTGLGLYICKGIVEAHGGRLTVESEGRGKGSEFRITIPQAESSAANLRVSGATA